MKSTKLRHLRYRQQTSDNMLQRTYVQTLRASFAPRTLAKIGRLKGGGVKNGKNRKYCYPSSTVL